VIIAAETHLRTFRFKWNNPTLLRDIIRCVFCRVEIGYWTDGDVPWRNISAGVHLSVSLKVSVLETFLLFLTTSKRNHLNSLWNRDMCVPLFELRTNSIPERSKYLYLYFLFCYIWVLLLRNNFQCTFTVTSHRNVKHGKRQHNCSQWDGPLAPQFGWLNTRMQSFPPGPLCPIKTLTI